MPSPERPDRPGRAPAHQGPAQQTAAARRALNMAEGKAVRVIGFGDGTAPATVGMTVGVRDGPSAAAPGTGP